ncbi:MAG: hypothetical protein LBC12_03940 [Nitrososphaerota archaeon]|jgi:hypothetical protein|nr:hypothetical protein [Nitrososphaerota archaeon]
MVCYRECSNCHVVIETEDENAITCPTCLEDALDKFNPEHFSKEQTDAIRKEYGIFAVDFGMYNTKEFLIKNYHCDGKETKIFVSKSDFGCFKFHRSNRIAELAGVISEMTNDEAIETVKKFLLKHEIKQADYKINPRKKTEKTCN